MLERDDNQPGAVGGGDVTFDYNNPLVDRFLATDSFLALYLERYAELYEVLFADDAVTDLIDEYSACWSKPTRHGVSLPRANCAAVDAKLLWVADRSAFLEELSGG